MRVGKRIWILASVLGTLLMLSPQLSSQTFYGSIVGTVTDSSGAIVPSATVTVTDVSTNERHTAQSNTSGEFSFVSLVPATYTVQVEQKSFKRFLRENVTVELNQRIRVDVAMQVGAVTETVEVSTETPQLQTGSGTMATVIEGKTINEMPLNGRDTFNLIALAPGVVPTQATQGTAELNSGGSTRTSIWGGYSISGGLVGQNAMYLDGMPLNVLGGGAQGGVIFVPTQDAVQEFSVSTNASTSEFGRFSGGVVNMTTKSGSNQFHATAYEYVRNSAFNANDWFNKRNQFLTGQPNKALEWTQNQYGVQAGAPIIKNKVFAMFSWEAFTAREGSINGPFTTVTPDMLAGNIDFGTSNAGYNATAAMQASQAWIQANRPQCNPTVISGRNALQLNGGQITATSGCFDPVSLVSMTEYPAPGSAGIIPVANGNNFQIAESEGSDRSSWVGRIDYDISTKQRLFGSIYRDTLADQPGQWMPGGKMPGGQPWDIGGGTTSNRVWAGVIGDTYTINPSAIVDLRFSVSRTYLGQTPPLLGNSGLANVFGGNIPNLAKQETSFNIPFVIFGNNGHNVVNDCPNGVAVCAPTGFNNANNASWNIFDGTSMIFGLTKLHGPHTLKMGGEVRFMDNYGLSLNNVGGTFNFYHDFFTQNYWGNFLLGLADQGSINTTREVAAYNLYQGYYINDTWQANKKLTVNVGLRWDLPGNIKEKKNNAIVLEPGIPDTTDYPGYSVPGTVSLVNSNLYPGRGDEPARIDLFAPNLGVAYRLTDRDVIHAGYGYSIVPIDVSPGLFPSTFSMNGNSTSWNAQQNGGTIHYSLSDPFPSSAYPNGINQPLTRGQVTQKALFGQGNTVLAPATSKVVPITQQWNLIVSHQFPGDLLVEVGYAGSKSNGLPLLGGANQGYNLNELSSVYWNDPSMAQPLSTSVPTTLTSTQIAQCKAVLGTATTYGQCARPYWAYGSYVDSYAPYGWVNYQSLPVHVQKRFRGGGLVNVAYTWAKTLSNAGGSTGGSGNGNPNVQDWDNLRAEKSVTSYDIPRRLVISYSYNLPIGKGQKFLTSGSGVVMRAVSGWTLNGITTFQDGFPQQILTNITNNVPQLFGAVVRPNYTMGCPKLAPGSVKSHTMRATPTSVFNNSCWSAPPVTYTGANGIGYSTTLGNEQRIDSQLRSQGPNNWDATLQKSTQITERASLEFRWEVFNVFNHERFGLPNMTFSQSAQGVVSSQFGTIGASGFGSNPRLQQLSLRLSF